MKNIIAEMLGKSPVHPIQRHIDTACESTALLVSLFAAANLNDWDKVDAINEDNKSINNNQ